MFSFLIQLITASCQKWCADEGADPEFDRSTRNRRLTDPRECPLFLSGKRKCAEESNEDVIPAAKKRRVCPFMGNVPENTNTIQPQEQNTRKSAPSCQFPGVAMSEGSDDYEDDGDLDDFCGAWLHKSFFVDELDLPKAQESNKGKRNCPPMVIFVEKQRPIEPLGLYHPSESWIYY